MEWREILRSTYASRLKKVRKNNDNRRKSSADMSVCCRYQYHCNQENNLKVVAFFFDNDMTLLFAVVLRIFEFSPIFFTSTIRLISFELNNKGVISVHITWLQHSPLIIRMSRIALIINTLCYRKQQEVNLEPVIWILCNIEQITKV